MSSDENEENFVIVTDDDEGGEANKMEVPLEDDGGLLLSTLNHAFDGALGLKYKNPNTGAFRVLKVNDEGRIFPPSEGWRAGKTVYYVIYQKAEKRKLDDGGGSESSGGKVKKSDLSQRKCSDLIALGLPYATNEDELRTYFEQYGEVVVSQIKRNHETGKSKGFGFIRFGSYESQLKALGTSHMIEGRPVTVKIPSSQEKSNQLGESRKVFVGRVPESMTEADLREYFGQKGEVSDVFVPKPYRAFAFVTFTEAEVAQSVCGEDHIIKGASVRVSIPTPIRSKEEKEKSFSQRSSYGQSRGGYGSGASGYAGFGDKGRPPMVKSDSRYQSPSQQESWSGQAGYGYGGPGGGYGGGYPYSPYGGYYAPSPQQMGWNQQPMYPQHQTAPPMHHQPSVATDGFLCGGGSQQSVGGGGPNAMTVTPQALQAAVQAALSNVIGTAGAQRPGTDMASMMRNQYGGSQEATAQDAEMNNSSWRRPV